MAKTKKKEVQKQGLRPSQKAKAEKLRKKQEAKKTAAALLLINENDTQSAVSASEVESQPSLSATTEKKTRAKVAISLTKDKKIVRMAASTTTKKTTRTTAKKSTEEEQPQVKENATEALKTITVKNAEGDPDTAAEILIQNKIDYTPKVSVVIPVYNVEPYLRQCLDSVLNQTLREIEIICVDDGSTDASLDILKEYAAKDNRITVITQKNLYAGVARNAGLSQAKGEYIHFLDSDDWVDVSIYSNMYKISIEKKLDFVKFKSFAYDNPSQRVFNWSYADLKKFPQNLFDKVITFRSYAEYLIEVLDTPWNGLYSRQFLTNNNCYFDNLICANDTSFFYRCLVRAQRIYISSEYHLYYRMNNNQSLIGIRAKNFDCQLRQFYIINSIISGLDDNISNNIRRKLITSIVERTESYLNNANYGDELKAKIEKQSKEFFDQLSYSIIPSSNIDFYYTHLKDDHSVKISVIIPVYNVEKYIEQCLDSICNQTLYTSMGNVLTAKGNIVYQNNFIPDDKLFAMLESFRSKTNYTGQLYSNYIETRTGMINFSVLGRDCPYSAREQYSSWDKENQEREEIAEKLRREFPDYEISVGGSISMDITPKGYGKGQIARHLRKQYPDDEIIFFGDKTFKGGNDYELAYELSLMDNTKVIQVDGYMEVLEKLKQFDNN